MVLLHLLIHITYAPVIKFLFSIYCLLFLFDFVTFYNKNVTVRCLFHLVFFQYTTKKVSFDIYNVYKKVTRFFYNTIKSMEKNA